MSDAGEKLTGAVGLGLTLGKTAIDFGMVASMSLARMLEIGCQSAAMGFAKYVELTEKEIERANRRESVKVQ